MSERHGGCQCGNVRYTLSGDPIVVYACHCRECQKQSASAFGLSLPVSIEDLEIRGTLSIYERATDRGGRSQGYFCSNCGSRVYHRLSDSRQRITLKGGTLDDPLAIEPVAHIWVRSKLAWVILPAGVPVHQTQPADLDRWRQTLGSVPRDDTPGV